MNEIAEQVKKWRQFCNLKQSELETQAGLSHNALSRIETGIVLPRLETLERLASALGISIEELQFKNPPTYQQRDKAVKIKTLWDDIQNLPEPTRSKIIIAFQSVVDLIKNKE